MTRQDETYKRQLCPLPAKIKVVVKEWADAGYPAVNGMSITPITRTLLNYWFNQEDSPFYRCQKEAIESLIYCYEILNKPNLSGLYKLFAPTHLEQSHHLKKITLGEFPEYCIKMATGTGKTWVLALALIWQYFNAVKGQDKRFAKHFLVIAPGIIVYKRLLDSFFGKEDLKGKRDVTKSDYFNESFFPEGYKEEFMKLKKLTKEDITPNMEITEEPFVLITNWHRLNFNVKRKKGTKLSDAIYYGFSDEDESLTETFKTLLTANQDLMIFNDEAHHVHESYGEDEKVWQESINLVYEKIKSDFGDTNLTQVDFSATPFETKQNKVIYFPHIIYDYDVIQAMNSMLVKQIFLETRNELTIDDLDKVDVQLRSKLIKINLEKEDIKAIRDRATKKFLDLSLAQKLLIQIGLKKLEQLEEEWAEAKINKKPVLFLLAEDNEVADMIEKEIAKMPNQHGKRYTIYDKNKPQEIPDILTIHSDRKGGLSDEEYERIRKHIFNIDDPSNPVKIILSVMMLKEGFDVNSVCVIVGLRALDSYVLAEQTIGRGLRLMFREPEYEEAKNESFDLLRNRQKPKDSFDQLFIVEHPTFREFYKWIEEEGANIGKGNSASISGAGDMIQVEVVEDRLKFNLAYPETLVTEFKEKSFDISKFNLAKIPKYPIPFEDMRKQAKVWLSEKHIGTENIARTWAFKTDIFDYNQFLRLITQDLIKDNNITNLSNYSSEIMGLVDDYCTNHLFGKRINYDEEENYTVLNIMELYGFIKKELRKELWNFLLSFNTETVLNAKWRKMSVMNFWRMKENSSVKVSKCIYEKLPFGHGAGLELKFVIEVLEKSQEVISYSKINDKRGSFHLHIKYLAEDGNYKSYFPDFIIKTDKKMFIVETKSDKDFEKDPDVKAKATNTKKMCQLFSKIKCPFKELNQPIEWEYVIIPESRFSKNQGLSFEALANVCKDATEFLINK